MRYRPDEFSRAIDAATGDEPALAHDLAAAFHLGVEGHRAALAAARSDADWRESAARLQGLAASFGSILLMRAASGAMQAPCGDPSALELIDRAIARIR